MYRAEMPLEHWKHFLALENDVNAMTRYIEPAVANYGTYSVELTKLFLSACSEVDVVCRVICARDCPTARAANMDDYRAALHGHFPNLHTIEICNSKYDLLFGAPWASWASNLNPAWWQEHNDVKHFRHQHFARASLGNALNAMAGLYVLLLYAYPKEGFFRPEQFFERPGGSGGFIITGGESRDGL